MLTDYQVFAITQIWPVLLVPVVGALLYWFQEKSGHIWNRVLIVAHCVLLLFAFGYAVAVSPFTGDENWLDFIWPFWVLLTLALVLLLHAFPRFDGNQRVHLIQFIVIPSGLLIWLVGTMTITHDWL